MASNFQENISLLRRFDPAMAEQLTRKLIASPNPPQEQARGSYATILADSQLPTLFIYGISSQAEEYLYLKKWLHAAFNHSSFTI